MIIPCMYTKYKNKLKIFDCVTKGFSPYTDDIVHMNTSIYKKESLFYNYTGTFNTDYGIISNLSMSFGGEKNV